MTRPPVRLNLINNRAKLNSSVERWIREAANLGDPHKAADLLRKRRRFVESERERLIGNGKIPGHLTGIQVVDIDGMISRLEGAAVRLQNAVDVLGPPKAT